MFRNILVPVDLTDRHERALAIAAEFAAHSGGQVTLLHVVQVVQGLPPETDPDFYRRLEDLSRRHLDGLLERLRGEAVEGRAVVRVGDRGPEVCRFAREAGTDVMVLSSHLVDPAAPGADWLSLSYLIGIGAPCPVLLVK